MIELSLVVATIGREKELDRLLHSLSGQQDMNFELIVVDQNNDDRIAKLVEIYASLFSIKHIKSRKGVSRARNAGAALAEGRILGFPDDDAWYHNDITRRVVQMIDAENLDVFAGKSMDPKSGSDVFRYRTNRAIVSRRNYTGCISAHSIFIRRTYFESIAGFNHDIGPGADTIWGGMEEHELILRYVRDGAIILYDPSIYIYHPLVSQSITAAKARSYAGGMGLLNALDSGYKPKLVWGLSRSLIGAAYNTLIFRHSRAAINLAAFVGRLSGYMVARRAIWSRKI